MKKWTILIMILVSLSAAVAGNETNDGINETIEPPEIVIEINDSNSSNESVVEEVEPTEEDTSELVFIEQILWKEELIDLYPLDYSHITNKIEPEEKEKKIGERDLEIINAKEVRIKDGTNELFVIKSTNDIKQVGNIAFSKEWAYSEHSKGTDIVTSKQDLVRKGQYICVDDSKITIGKGVTQKTIWTDCLYYPQQYENVSVNSQFYNVYTGKTETANWKFIPTTSIKIDENEVTINYEGPYDPTLTNYTDLRSYHAFNETSGTTFVESSQSNYGYNFTCNTGDAQFYSGSDCQDNGTCVGFNTVNEDGGSETGGDLLRANYDKTIIAWIKSGTNTDDWKTFIGSDNQLKIIKDSSGNIECQTRANDSSWYSVDYDTEINLRDEWHLYVCAWDDAAKTIKASLDCGSFSTNSVDLDEYDDAQYAGVGGASKSAQLTNATFQHVALYERVLSVADCLTFMDDTNGTSTGGSDTTDPVISISAPTSTTYASNVTTLSTTASDNVALSACYYDIGSGNVSFTCNQDVTSLNAGPGNHTWTVYAVDTSSNIGSDSVSFTVSEASSSGNNVIIRPGLIQVAQWYAIGEYFGMTQLSGLYLCEDASCSSTCELEIRGGLITACN